MMKVRINELEREWGEINPSWVHDQINGRQQAGEPVCVAVRIKRGDVNVELSVGECPASAGGGGRPNSHELEVFSLWERMGMKEIPINSGRLVAFLQQVKNK